MFYNDKKEEATLGKCHKEASLGKCYEDIFA